jgi:hypothetical protein
MALAQSDRFVRRHRGAKINAVFAAVPADYNTLGDCHDVAVAHSRLDCDECRAHRAVLYDGSAPDEILFFGAFDRRGLVNEIGRRLRTISSRVLPPGWINSIVLLRLSDQEQSMAIDFSTVNWLYVAIMAVFAFVAALLGGLISFRNRLGGALLAAILFAAMYVVWNYYPHPQIQLPIVTAYSTPSGG